MKETRNIEYKETLTPTFLKTVSAFSNGEGGRIVFGVSDDGTVVGVEDPEQLALDIENSINDSIKPRPDYSLDIDYENGTVSLIVPEGEDKPYSDRSRAYTRKGSSTVEMDTPELKRLIMKALHVTFDALESDQDLEASTFMKLEAALQNKVGINSLTNDTLKTLGLVSLKGELTNAGALLADINSFTGVDMARFGKNISEILDRETLAGISILDQYDKAVSTFKRYYQYERIEGFYRVSHERIPEAAFREALANALVHRNWDSNAHIRIEMYDSKVVISSPGGLTEGITEEEYLSGDVSVLRNPLVANVFFRLNLIENFGTGVRRIRACYAGTPMAPIFRVSENVIVVELPVVETRTDLSEDELTVMTLCKDEGPLTRQAIENETGFGKDKVLALLEKVIDAGYVKKVGTGRSTRYTWA